MQNVAGKADGGGQIVADHDDRDAVVLIERPDQIVKLGGGGGIQPGGGLVGKLPQSGQQALVRAAAQGHLVPVEEEIDGALENLNEETQEDAARKILEKYMRGKNTDKETLSKAFRYLMSKGFTYETAKSALSELADLDGG